MTGYTRQSLAEIQDGEDIIAAPLNNEFDALQEAFDAVTGHTHDGTVGNGPKVSLTGSVSGILPIANGGTNASTASAARDSLGLTIGTNVQAYDAGLQSISGLTTAADKMIYTTALDTYAVTDLTSFARTLLDDGDAATARATLGVSIGSQVQAYDAGLQSISGLTTAADQMVYTTASDTYAVTSLTAFARTLLDDTDASTARTTLGLTIGTNVQAYDAGLQSISGLTTAADQMVYTTASDTYATTALTAFARTILDDADAATARTTLGLGSLSTLSTINGDLWSGTDLAVADGGTGASDAATARTNLGAAASAQQIIAGDGLTGGGDLSANRTVTLGTPSNITNSTTNSVTATSHTHALGFTAAEVYTGTGENDTSFPLGHLLAVANGGSSTARNASTSLYLSTGTNYAYTDSVDGTQLSGTWRARGGRVGSAEITLFQRVA